MNTKLIEMIAQATTEMNADYKARFVNSLLARRDRLDAFVSSPEYKKLNTTERYEQRFNIAGGKTWHEIIRGNTNDAIIKVAEKHCDAIIEKRNAAIAKKLNFNITDIMSADIVHDNGGFEGMYLLDTNQGKVLVTITVIVAGGPVQRMHNRTLIKVKKLEKRK